jgi:hypothetical protein
LPCGLFTALRRAARRAERYAGGVRPLHACLAGIAVALAAGNAQAEDARVVVELVGPGEATAFFEVPLEAALARLPVAVEARAQRELDVRGLLRLGPSPALARIWIDARDDARLSMFLADASGQRLLVRHVPSTSARDVVAREEICQIVESSVEALLGGGAIGVSRDQAAAQLVPRPDTSAPLPPAPAPARAPKSRAPLAPTRSSPASASADVGPSMRADSVGVFAGYHFAAWSDSVRLHGPALGAHWFHPLGRLGWGMAATAELRFPQAVTGDLVGMEVRAVSLRAVPRLAFQLGPLVRGHLGLGPGIDLIESGPVPAAGSSAALGPSERYATGVLRLELGVDLRAFETASLLLALAADVDGTQTRYTARVDEARREVFVSWRAHPVVSATLTTDLLGRAGR